MTHPGNETSNVETKSAFVHVIAWAWYWLFMFFLLGHFAWVLFTYDDGIAHWDRWVIQTETGWETYSPGVASVADYRGFVAIVIAGSLFLLTEIYLLIRYPWWISLLSLPGFFMASTCTCMLPVSFLPLPAVNMPWSAGFYGGVMMLMLPALVIFWCVHLPITISRAIQRLRSNHAAI